MSARLPLADITFIAEFAAFARAKGDEAYDYANSHACALTQFGFPGLDSDEIIERLGQRVEIALNKSTSFSALATRLEALIADAPVVRQA